MHVSLLKYSKYLTKIHLYILFLTKQGLLQNVHFIFDTTVEDVLLSRDCEITKQGKSGV